MKALSFQRPIFRHSGILATKLFLGVLTFIFAAGFLQPSDLAAQDQVKATAADTSSPRATLKSFIDACNEVNRLIHSEKYFDRRSPEHAEVALKVLDCIDQSELPAYARIDLAGEVAVCIKEIIDREELPPWEEIPDEEHIEAAGGLEKFPLWRIPGTRITIARVEDGPQRHEYLFSPGTADRAVEYFNNIKSKPYRTTGPEVSEDFHQWYVSSPGHPALAKIVEILPRWMQRGRTFGLANWKWPGLLLAVLVSIGLMAAAYCCQIHFARRWLTMGLLRHWLTIVFPVAAMLVPLGLEHFSQHYLTIRGIPLYILTSGAIAATLFAATIVIFSASNRIAESIIASPQVNPHGLNAQLIRIVSKLASVVIVAIVLLSGGQFLGIPVATLLTSAGIGGLAVAFGAQDTLKTLFGTIMLMGDKPFRVGDRIMFKQHDGVVEDIGLRSTRIRLLTGNLVTVPNDELARSDIENVGQRPYIRRIADLHIPLDTPREKLEKAIEVIREALTDHQGMDPELPPRVFFTDFNPTAFNIRVIYWFNPPKYWEFLELNEQVNLQIMRAFEEQGIQFSLPFRVTHTSLDSEQTPVEVKMVE